MKIPGLDGLDERLESLDDFRVKAEGYLERIVTAVERLVEIEEERNG